MSGRRQARTRLAAARQEPPGAGARGPVGQDCCVRRAFPDLTVGWCARSVALHPEAKERVLDGLARAGLTARDRLSQWPDAAAAPRTWATSMSRRLRLGRYVAVAIGKTDRS